MTHAIALLGLLLLPSLRALSTEAVLLAREAAEARRQHAPRPQAYRNRPHAQLARRTALWCAVHGIDLGSRTIHGVRVGAAR